MTEDATWRVYESHGSRHRVRTTAIFTRECIVCGACFCHGRTLIKEGACPGVLIFECPTMDDTPVKFEGEGA